MNKNDKLIIKILDTMIKLNDYSDVEYSEKVLKKKLSDHRFMLRLGKAVVLCKYLHEFGINIPFRFFVLPDYIHGRIQQRLKGKN